MPASEIPAQEKTAPNELIDSEFRAFAEIGEQIAATPAKLEKVRILAEYLRTLEPEQIRHAAVFLTGRAFAQTDQRTLQTGWAIIYRALLSASRLGNASLRRIASSHGDASKAAREALEGRTKPEPFSLGEANLLFEELHKTRGPAGKTDLLAARLARLSPLEAQYVVKILTGDLRIGLREGLVEEAIARAFDVDLEELKEAHMLLGDIGETALLAFRHELDRAELSLFRPIKVMLASPEATAEAIWERFGNRPNESTVYVEDKFDGIRAQMHRSRTRVEFFSRDLRRITGQFEELAERARDLTAEVILDGEIMAFEHGKKLTFFDLQKRLGRKSEGADLFAVPSADVPVVFVAFDLLWLNGRSLLKAPLRERRELLRSLTMPAQFQIADISPVRSAEEIEAAFQMARRRFNEGLMVKDPESQYTPGPARDVVVQAEEGTGHARRRGGGRRSRTWQAQPCAERLHFRGARRRDRESSADRESLQWPDRC